MGDIYRLKTPIATIEFTLDYDSAKDKYYLTVCAYGDLWTETFYGDWALKDYLIVNWNFTESQIIELMAGIYDAA